MNIGLPLWAQRVKTKLALSGNFWAFAVDVGTSMVKVRALAVIGAGTVWTLIAVKG